MIAVPATVSLICCEGQPPILQVIPRETGWTLRLELSELTLAGLLVSLAEHAARREEGRQ